MSRVDLHVHSKFSDRPSEWFLRRIGAPESFVEPLDLYRSCRERGMDFVTVTDHNNIAGALEIAHLPGTFISVEVTTYFPENGCKIHCLVFGINEKVFHDIQEIRPSIYDLRAYLLQNQILHSIAHPLFRNNDRLTADDFEKLIVLFNRFEGLNGSRHPRACRIANAIFESLTPEVLAQLADRHGLEPAGPEPWKKILTGGSDDHSGLHSGFAWTETPPARTVFDLLQHLRDGQHKPGGRHGTSMQLAHSLYHITYSYYRSRIAGGTKNDGGLIGAMLQKLAGREDLSSGGVASILPPAVNRFFIERRKRKLSDIERLLIDEFTAIRKLQDQNKREGNNQSDEERERLGFETACRMGQQLIHAFIQRGLEQIRQGNLIESLQSLSSLGPVLLGMTPYLTAFGAQHKDENLLQAVASRFPAAGQLQRRSGKKAWITDTFLDVNGVAHTIHSVAGIAASRQIPMTVITCLPEDPEAPFPLKNFKPAGCFSVPEYESQQIAFPPFLEIFEFIEREEFDELIISTPGPMGLAGLAAARLFKLRVKGVYHTDFPRYVRHLTDDDSLEDLTWSYMSWFYSSMDHVYAPSRHYLTQLADKGIDPARLSVFSRGVDTQRFNPSKRKPEFWDRYGINGGFKFLYVGRISREKNIEAMIRAFQLCRAEMPDAQLVVVGDGPHLDELRATYQKNGVLFTGRLTGDDLALAYAGSDTFVFPSMTDTFGNAVLEAHASGLPAIVSECGGPAEIVRSHGSGLVTDTRHPEAIAEAMRQLCFDKDLRDAMKTGAIARANQSRWETVMEQFEMG